MFLSKGSAMKNRLALPVRGLPGLFLLGLTIFSLLFAPSAFAASVVLYDGSLGTLPGFPFWAYEEEDDAGNQTTPFLQNNAVVIDTTGNRDIKAGFSTRTDLNPALAQSMDRTKGFTLWVKAQLLSEEHFTDEDPLKDRAGYNVIVLSEDLLGIEIAFWENEIWAQEFVPGDGSQRFIKAEGTAADPTSGQRQYAIWVRGDEYRFFLDGNAGFQGSLRDYSTEGFPYNEANFIFFGDNSTSALGASATANVSLSFHVPGDLNGSGDATLVDALIALQVLAGLSPAELDPEWAITGGDVDGDFQAGLAEVIYALQWSAAVRE
jgi:hypothetical protein